MTDCVFLVADSNMKACFEGFLERERFHLSLGTGEFTWDLIVDSECNDPGVYRRAHDLLRPYLQTHRYAVVALDNEWHGSPGPQGIAEGISGNLRSNGWSDRHCVVVVEPEIENWIWQDSPHVERILRHQRPPTLKEQLATAGSWSMNQAKPSRPKELLAEVLRRQRIPRSSSIYRQVTQNVSIRGCSDPAFQHLQSALADWFPAEYA